MKNSKVKNLKRTCQNMMAMETSRSENNDVLPSSSHKMSSEVSKFDSFWKKIEIENGLTAKVSGHPLPATPPPTTTTALLLWTGLNHIFELWSNNLIWVHNKDH